MSDRERRQRRRRELAEKRARLDELRKQKTRRAAAADKNKSLTSSSSATTESRRAVGKTGAGELDSLIDSLLSEPAPAGAGAPSGSLAKENLENGINDDGDGSIEKGESRTQRTAPESVAAERRPLSLTSGAACGVIGFSPGVAYEKGTQTDDVTVLDDDGKVLASPNPSLVGSVRKPMMVARSSSAGTSSSTRERASSSSSQRSQNGDGRNLETVLEDAAATAPAPLSADEISTIVSSDDYEKFVTDSTRVLTRVLEQNGTFDVLVDYSGSQLSTTQSAKMTLIKSGATLSANWSAGRAVTAMAWSPHFKDLFAVSYNKPKSGSGGASDSIVALWSLNTVQRPEYVFRCHETIETVCFDPFSPHLVIGGAYSGQVMVWDLRANAAPVRYTLLSCGAHTHPVFSMVVVGTENSHSLVSVSTDGHLCSFSLADLTAPTTSKVLTWDKRDVAVTAMRFADGETNDACMGAEDGGIYRVLVHGSNAGVQVRKEAHGAPVTALSFHPNSPGSRFLSSLVLSSSMDWTVKLWSHDRNGPEKALHTFDHGTNYVYDVQWSPVHPSVFASVDGAGCIHLWNLNVDLEQPVEVIDISESDNTDESSALAAHRGLPLCRLHWSADGKKLVAGNENGDVRIYDIAAELASPKREAWTKFDATVASLL